MKQVLRQAHKGQRLTNPELVLVKEEGRMVQGRWFGVLLREDDGEKEAKFGLIVSNKVSRKAVERSRIKRKLREVVRRVLPEMAKGTQMVILGGKGVLGAEVTEIEKEMRRVMTGAGVMENKKK